MKENPLLKLEALWPKHLDGFHPARDDFVG